MKILVDADSCPKGARELVLRTSVRRGILVVFAANRPLHGIGGENIVMEVCPPGENSADNRIVELAEPGDLAVSRDLALAKRLLEKGVAVIDDRGRTFSRDSINELLSLRDFTVGLAENGLDYERIANYGKKECKAFADSLDRQLVKLLGIRDRGSGIRGCCSEYDGASGLYPGTSDHTPQSPVPDP